MGPGSGDRVIGCSLHRRTTPSEGDWRARSLRSYRRTRRGNTTADRRGIRVVRVQFSQIGDNFCQIFETWNRSNQKGLAGSEGVQQSSATISVPAIGVAAPGACNGLRFVAHRDRVEQFRELLASGHLTRARSSAPLRSCSGVEVRDCWRKRAVRDSCRPHASDLPYFSQPAISFKGRCLP